METADIKKLIEDMLNCIPIDFDAVEISENSEANQTLFVIKTKEPELLIGENGETFYALTHLLRRMADKDADHPRNFSIDVNDYQRNLMEQLKVKALTLAQQVRDTKANIEMEPMSSYERLIVHGALNNLPNIKSESIGDGKERRVVIKFID